MNWIFLFSNPAFLAIAKTVVESSPPLRRTMAFFMKILCNKLTNEFMNFIFSPALQASRILVLLLFLGVVSSVG